MINPLLKILKFYITPFQLNATAAVVVGGALAARSARKSAQSAAGVQAGAARDAASAQAESTKLSIAEQRRQFDLTQKQAEPFRQAELASLQQREPLRAEALSQQAALTGLSGAGAQEAALAQLQQSPGQAFLRDRGEQAILRGASATGGLGGARVQEALQQQGIGIAQQDLQSQLARLGGFTGVQGAGTTQNLAALGANQASNVGNLIQAGGQAQAQGLMNAGQAQAGGILGAGAAQSKFYGQAAGALAGKL